MQIAAPPPAVSQLKAAHIAREISNKQSMQKFQNSVPEDQVTLSEQAKRIRLADNARSNGNKPPSSADSLNDVSTAQHLDQRRQMNSTAANGVNLMYSDNINDELTVDRRLINDSVFEYAISSARSLKADNALSAGTGDSINLMVKSDKTDPSLLDMTESRKQFDMNDNYDLRHNLAKSAQGGERELDMLRMNDLGRHTDTPFAVENVNQPKLPDANKALAMKKYAQVAQSQEI